MKITKKYLKQEYVKNQKSMRRIAIDLNIRASNVRYWIKKYNIPVFTSGRRRTINLSGQKFGNLLVLKQSHANKHCAIWICKCVCGQIIQAKSPVLRRGMQKSCGSGKCRPNCTMVGAISQTYWSYVKRCAIARKIKFNITLKDMWNQFLKQNGKCALTGELLTLPVKTSDINYNASLDRINSQKPYIKNNIQWVLKKINKMKFDLNEQEFIDLCAKIIKYKKGE